MLAGVVIGVVLSLVLARLRRHHAAIPLLSRSPTRRSSATPTSTPVTRRSTASSSCGWTSASPSRPPRRSRNASATLIDAEPPRAVVLDFAGVDFIDSQGSEKLGELVEAARTHPTGPFRLARVKPSIVDVLERDGVLDRVRADHVHRNVNEAVEAELAAGVPRR